MTEDDRHIIDALLKASEGFSDEVIEASVIEYISSKTSMPFAYEGDLKGYQNKGKRELIENFGELHMPICIEFIIEFFESLLDQDNINENGIVFTPKYIADYIFDKATPEFDFSDLPKIIDPSCGCGIFLASSAIKLHNKLNMSFKDILNKAIFGIELDKDNARRCNVVLNLLPLMFGESNEGLNVNIKCTDSLKCNWCEEFNVKGYDFIFGNPPYVNTHDMTKETSKFLKETFSSTRSGVYNIFYAFIEHAYSFLKSNGMLSYIVPNNFLTIKSATGLRKFISLRKCLKMILDFSDNMVFKPVRTYNCIIQITRTQNEYLQYCVMKSCDNIQEGLNRIEFDIMPLNRLDDNSWKLVGKKTRENLNKIENQFIGIKEFIRTGIATLRDDVYIVESDNLGYYKTVEGKRHYLEDDIVKRLYKIPELKKDAKLQNICRYIIFPYRKGKSGFEIIPEDELKNDYPQTYEYLYLMRSELDSRDKGKPNNVAWYAYGRTQGLNRYGKKLLFPTFSNTPKFKLVDDEYALFCNGYAVFQNERVELEVLRRILNSVLMKYYVSNTSYAIEGGYFCYQKKYIERFSLPLLTEEEKKDILSLQGQELDSYLIKLYNLDIQL